MNILAIDTSSENMSFCIVQEDKVLVNINRKIKFGASSIIVYLEKYRLYLEKINGLVIGAGPGSFTGLRISFAIVKALSLSLEKPVIKIGSFLAMAYPFKGKYDRITVITDARRNMIYVAVFDKNLRQKNKEKLMFIEDCIAAHKSSFFITYDSYLREKVLSLYPTINFYPRDVFPQAKYLCYLAGEYYNKGKFTPREKLEPLYIHPKTCQVRAKSKGPGA